ncbi:kinase-like domain-containing protein [Tanacetum coccineum]|uniref:Kinase-like domain-containing protein n=1 Tax=Tanacetum coccineum TaxID=301880 RepID=A0ABQ5AG61_9ASTR
MKILKDIDAETDIVLKLDDPSSVLKQGEDVRSSNRKVFTPDELMRPATNYDQSTFLGEGGFESVHKGVIKRLEHPFDNFRVAVKRCKRGPKASLFMALQPETIERGNSIASSTMTVRYFVAIGKFDQGLVQRTAYWCFGPLIKELVNAVSILRRAFGTCLPSATNGNRTT